MQTKGTLHLVYIERLLGITHEHAAAVVDAVCAVAGNAVAWTDVDAAGAPPTVAGITGAIRRAADRHVGRTAPPDYQRRHHSTRHPWWDRELHAAAAARRRVAREYHRTADPSLLPVLRAARLRGKTLADQKLRAWLQRRDQHLADTLERTGPTRAFWSTAKSLIEAPPTRIPGVQLPDGTVSDDPLAMCTAFHAMFEVLARNPGPPGYYDPGAETHTAARLAEMAAQSRETSRAAAAAGMPPAAHDAPPTIQEVRSAIGHLAYAAAPGPDAISPPLLKVAANELAPALTALFQHIFETEQVPPEFQRGTIVPLFKAGNPADPANYRGITLQAVLSKVFCLVLLGRLQPLLDPRPGSDQAARATAAGVRPLNTEQAGFRRGRGCIDHAFVLKTAIDDTLARGDGLLAAFLDIKKAYDSVWRDALWCKLYERGVRGKLWRMLRALYSSVEATVRVNDAHSAPFQLANGLRQGCVLSPLLFNVFIDDLVDDLRRADVGIALGPQRQVRIPALLFADDVTLVARDAVGLHRAFEFYELWCRKWRMETNVAKSKILCVGAAAA